MTASEEVEWEARRVAAAIGADEFRLRHYENRLIQRRNWNYSETSARYCGLWNEAQIGWEIVAEGVLLRDIYIGSQDHCLIFREVTDSTEAGLVWGPWAMKESAFLKPPRIFKEQMGRALYRLGIEVEDEQWLKPLNFSLSAHEKLECRLAMPREFWPKTWLNEDTK